jgi:hypothetical protein
VILLIARGVGMGASNRVEQQGTPMLPLVGVGQ